MYPILRIILIPALTTALGFFVRISKKRKADEIEEKGAPSGGVPTVEELRKAYAPGFIYREVHGARWGDASPVLFVFHGMGADPARISKLVDPSKPAKIIIPRGPIGKGSNWKWWTLRALDKDQEELSKQMYDAAVNMRPLVQGAEAANPSSAIVVSGHSQGAMLAAAAARILPEVDGAATASGWLPRGLWGQSSPVVNAHGTADPFVPYPRTKGWADQRSEVALVTVEGHGHGISGPLLDAWKKAIDDSL